MHSRLSSSQFSQSFDTGLEDLDFESTFIYENYFKLALYQSHEPSWGNLHFYF